MQRPFDDMRDMFKKATEENKDLFKYVFEKSDSFSLWIIGLSIGGISIFANNIGNAKQGLNSHYLKAILILLAVSVITGILYRVFFLFFYRVSMETFRGVEISFTRGKLMATESSLKGSETYEQLIAILIDDFDENFTTLIPIYNQSNEISKKEMYQTLLNHYTAQVSWAKKDQELAEDFIADTYSKFTGTKKEKYIKAFKSGNSANEFRIVLGITMLLYVIYLLTFFTAILLFAFST